MCKCWNTCQRLWSHHHHPTWHKIHSSRDLSFCLLGISLHHQNMGPLWAVTLSFDSNGQDYRTVWNAFLSKNSCFKNISMLSWYKKSKCELEKTLRFPTSSLSHWSPTASSCPLVFSVVSLLLLPSCCALLRLATGPWGAKRLLSVLNVLCSDG